MKNWYMNKQEYPTKEKNKAWEAALPGLKSHCKSTEIKIVCGIGLRMIKDFVIIIPGIYSHISILICIFRIKTQHM